MARLHPRALWRSIGGIGTGIALGATALVVGPLVGVASAAPLTFTVNTPSNADDPTPDGVCNTCSLREAIAEANANPGPDTINFNIPAPYRILLNKVLPPITSPVTIDGTSLPGFNPANGVMVRIDGNIATTGIASLIRIVAGADGSAIKSLDLVRSGTGVEIRGADGNTVTGVYAGITQTGRVDCGTNCALNIGVRIVDGSNNVIGGTTPAARNVLSNNSIAGVLIRTETGTSEDNVVQGNYLGTNPAGNLARPNMDGFVQFGDSDGTMVGGSTPGSGNLASGNLSSGIILEEGGGQIAGNVVGLAADGDTMLPNREFGVVVEEVTTGVIVGGPTDAFRNVISGNEGIGLLVEGEDGLDHNHLVSRNYVGTDVTGTKDRGNTGRGLDLFLDTGAVVDSNVVAGNDGDNVRLAACATCNPVLGAGQQFTDNIVGLASNGLTPLTSGGRGVFIDDGVSVLVEGNTISGNAQEGIFIQFAVDATIVGNTIGLDQSGALKRANGGVGIGGSEVTSTTIGAIGNGNTIAGNTAPSNGAGGISLTASSDVTIQANKIGTKPSGNIALANTGIGINVSTSNQIQVGGTLAGQGNVIAANTLDGVRFTNTDDSTVVGNRIGLAANNKALGNGGPGVALLDGSDNNVVGDGSTAGRNRITNNAGSGVTVVGSVGNSIRNNVIRLNLELGIDLKGDDAVLANDDDDVDAGANNGQNYPVLLASNSGVGTSINGSLNSTPSRQFVIDFISNTTCDASGNGEGAVFLGSQLVTTNASGDTGFIANVPGTAGDGDAVTATATDTTTGDTSEFSACVINGIV